MTQAECDEGGGLAMSGVRAFWGQEQHVRRPWGEWLLDAFKE